MNVIQPNCRIQFTAEDVEFIVSVLGSKAGATETLTRLLADEETRDLILDDEALFRAVLEQRACLRISTRRQTKRPTEPSSHTPSRRCSASRAA